MRFQHLWAVRQLLLVLAEEARSVRIEPAGIEGEGVDLIVALPDRHDEYQQCKRSYRQAGKWTLKTLDSEGVLAALGARLRTNRDATFRLVSVDNAPELRDLAEAARASHDPTSFYRDQVQASQERGQAFEQFCSALGLDRTEPADLAEARDLLSRTFTTLVGDDEATLRELQSSSRYWVDGDPRLVVAALESRAQEALRRALTAVDIEEYLGSHGFCLRVLARDDRILPAVRQLQEAFDSSLTTQLVGGELLSREEAEQLMQLLEDPKGPRFLALHGPAGVGKSGVLLDLTRRLSDRAIPFLPLRLDRQRPSGTSRQFGDSLGLPESPAFCLEAHSGGQLAVLMLDQLDALRWTGAEAAQALETCRRLVGEAMACRHLRVVACCRTFDLEHDPQIRSWIEHHDARKVAVDRLPENVVRSVVSSPGVDPDSLTKRQLELLRTIQHLRAWEETVRITGSAVAFGTERELLDEFWRSRLLEASRMGLDSAEVQGALNRLVQYMDRGSTLVAPRRLLRESPRTEEALLSLNVLMLARDRLSFCHQSYLDHQLAYLLLRRIHEEGESVVGWLTGAHQGLFRREQLRLVLGLLREESFEQYLATVRTLIESPAVRFHLKQLVLQFLGQVEQPRPGERDQILTLLRDDEWREHVVADVLSGHPPWFLVAVEGGFVESWLESDDHKRDKAFGLIRSVVEECGEECRSLLSSVVGRSDEWSGRVAAALPMDPAKDSPSLFEMRLGLAEQGLGWSYLDWKGLSGTSLTRSVRLLHVILSRIGRRDSEPPRLDGLLHGVGGVELGGSSFSELLDAWTTLVPTAAQAIGCDVEDETIPVFEEDRDWRVHLREFLRRLTAELVSSNGQYMLDLQDQLPNLLGELLVLEGLAKLEESKVADNALRWLMARPHRLRLRWSGSDLPWEVSRRAVENLTRQSSPLAYTSFEQFVLEFREAKLRESLEWRHEILTSPPEGRLRFEDWALRYPSCLGETAYHLLPCLPRGQISPSAERRFMELQRKFAEVSDLYFTGWGKVQAGTVGSPLRQERLNELSDSTWLEIIRRNTSPPSNVRWTHRYREGRFEESSPRAFASDLQAATTREPGRFARLLLRFPSGTNPLYFGAVVRGLRLQARTKPPAEDATLHELETVLALPPVRSDPSLAGDVAWLLESRAGLAWSAATLALLARISVEDPDPAPGELHVGEPDDWTPRNLMSNSLNCTRGAAAHSIANLLFANPERFEVFEEAIEHVVSDSHPAVRASGFYCCLAALENQPQRSIQWALKGAQGLETLLACSSFDRFLLYASRRFPAEIEPTLRQMLSSQHEDVVGIGAAHTVALYLLTGRMKMEALGCLGGEVQKRIGAARVASAFAASPDHSEEARAMLQDLMNDENDSALKEVASAFQDTTLDLFAEDPEFLDSYASSGAFRLHPTTLLHKLHNYTGSLLPFAECILTVCRSLADDQAENRDRQRWEIDYYLSPILLRLYEQAPNEDAVRDLCLDAWDLLLKARAVSASKLTYQLDTD